MRLQPRCWLVMQLNLKNPVLGPLRLAGVSPSRAMDQGLQFQTQFQVVGRCSPLVLCHKSLSGGFIRASMYEEPERKRKRQREKGPARKRTSKMAATVFCNLHRSDIPSLLSYSIHWKHVTGSSPCSDEADYTRQRIPEGRGLWESIQKAAYHRHGTEVDFVLLLDAEQVGHSVPQFFYP